MKRFLRLLAVVVLFLPTMTNAQEDESCTGIQLDFGADLVSRYVWRGFQLGGNSPSIQPYASLTAGNLEFGFWGAYSVSGLNTGQEFDLYMTYTFANDMITATVNDYYFPDAFAGYNYFNYAAPSTGHLLEGILSFNGTENIPVSFLVATNFFGADAMKLESDPNSADFNQTTGLQYSTYLELGYSTSVKNVGLDLFVGGTINSTQEADAATGFIGEAGFYSDKPAVINAGFSLSKDIEITEKFALPVSTSVIANPNMKQMFFVIGISF